MIDLQRCDLTQYGSEAQTHNVAVNQSKCSLEAARYHTGQHTHLHTGGFCLSAPTDELSNAEISPLYDLKITEAETLMATLRDRLGQGEEGQLQDFSSVVSMIVCLSCATLPEQQ